MTDAILFFFTFVITGAISYLFWLAAWFTWQVTNPDSKYYNGASKLLRVIAVLYGFASLCFANASVRSMIALMETVK